MLGIRVKEKSHCGLQQVESAGCRPTAPLQQSCSWTPCGDVHMGRRLALASALTASPASLPGRFWESCVFGAGLHFALGLAHSLRSRWSVSCTRWWWQCCRV